ncbi:MAG: hypothetical protein FWD23_07895 [Oscillospiraceae bacterium]|nr:hypothetical protein [Oscillospiraceae bacterium]
MNDFLDNLGKTVNETAKKAMKASGNFLELTKTSLSIKFDEAKRDSFFREIGKIVYGDYKKSPEGKSAEILDFCASIDEIESAIKIQKAKAANIKNKKYCSECGVILEKSVNYCYSCGAKQPEIAGEDENENDECCCCHEEECCAEPECCDGGEGEGEGACCCSDEECCCEDGGEKQEEE